MKKILFLLFSFLFFTLNAAFALDVVYPAKKEVTINAQSTFFIGNATPNSTVKINSHVVKMWDEGIFVQIVPLSYGVNTITVESRYKNKVEKQVFKVKRNKSSSSGKTLSVPFEPKQEGTYLYTKTINDNSTVREKATKNSKRVIELPKGVVLYLAGKKGDYYKIEEQGKTDFWIHKSNLEEPVVVSKKFKAEVSKPETYSDRKRLYNYTKFSITHPVMYTFEQHRKKLKLTLYGVKDLSNPYSKDNNLEIEFEDDNQVLGYDAYFEDDKLIVRRARIPDKVNPYAPLHGVRIFIDAGHGGVEKGVVGPTRVKEKDVNLAIAKKVIKMLQEEGAIVSYSRLEDKTVPLNDRVKMAKENDAFISLSIHNNSLPNGKNPYVNHGTETHYYNDNAKVLAYIIKSNLARDLNIKDNGLYKTSFAMNRSTTPVSVLVEVAYMINPEEYMLIKTDKAQTIAAKSIVKSLKEFMIVMKK